jgi:putative transposase
LRRRYYRARLYRRNTPQNEQYPTKPALFCQCRSNSLSTPLRKTDAYIGIDRNTTGHIVVTANPDTGKIEKFGKQAIHTHKKYSNTRKRLQKQGKYRQVKRLRNRESRVVKNINHEVSRKIVKMAVEQNATIVFEDLSGIRTTKKQAKSFKYSLHSWSFYQLQQYVEYKANMFGIPVVYIDPAYTSQDCSKCNNRGKRTGKLLSVQFVDTLIMQT